MAEVRLFDFSIASVFAALSLLGYFVRCNELDQSLPFKVSSIAIATLKRYPAHTFYG